MFGWTSQWPWYGWARRTDDGPQNGARLVAVLLAGTCLLTVTGPTHAVTYSDLHKLTASDAAAYDRFGLSVAISGSTAVVGAYGDNTAGPAYVFDVASGNELLTDVAPLPNGDGTIDVGDLAVVGFNWSGGGSGNPLSAGTSVPVPSAGTAGIITLTGAIGHRNIRRAAKTRDRRMTASPNSSRRRHHDRQDSTCQAARSLET